MSRKTARYTQGEIGGVRVVGFFKREAKERHVPYQRMIRALVDAYAERRER